MAGTKDRAAQQHLEELQSSPYASTGLAAGAYGSDLATAFTDPNTGAQISGSGMIPTAGGVKSISELVLGARQPKNLSKIRSALIANGLVSKNTKSLGTIQNTWLQVLIGASSAQMDPFDYMSQLRASGFGQDAAAANVPTRQVYKYTDADRIKMIDDVSQNLRGQKITEEDKQTEWYKNLKKSIDDMVAQGTVTTTKEVKNPKTGKIETLVTQTPGFSQEKAAATAEAAIRKATPQDVARQDRVGFTDWLFTNLEGK